MRGRLQRVHDGVADVFGLQERHLFLQPFHLGAAARIRDMASGGTLQQFPGGPLPAVNLIKLA
jgi:hypothetical protein